MNSSETATCRSGLVTSRSSNGEFGIPATGALGQARPAKGTVRLSPALFNSALCSVWPLLSTSIPTRLAAQKTTPTPDLMRQWRHLFDSEPPPFNRRYLESRLAYRIHELAYDGLKPETMRRPERLGDELDGGRQEEARAAR